VGITTAEGKVIANSAIDLRSRPIGAPGISLIKQAIGRVAGADSWQEKSGFLPYATNRLSVKFVGKVKASGRSAISTAKVQDEAVIAFATGLRR